MSYFINDSKNNQHVCHIVYLHITFSISGIEPTSEQLWYISKAVQSVVSMLDETKLDKYLD